MITIAGAFLHFDTIQKILKENNFIELFEKFGQKLCVYDGVNNLPWNGGRMNKDCPGKFNEDQLKVYNSQGIGVFLCYTNPVIDYSMREPYNLIDKLYENDLNGIILINKGLYTILKRKYPNLRLRYSISGWDRSTDIKDYNIFKIQNSYEMFAPKIEWLFNREYYNTYDLNKSEVMLNIGCRFGCPFFKAHYRMMALANESEDYAMCVKRCYSLDRDDAPHPNLHFTGRFNQEDILEALRIGYTNFKITGRELKQRSFEKEIKFYLNEILKALIKFNKIL